MFAVKILCGCKLVRPCFMAVGHTKFQPDSWFGELKRSIKHRNVDSIRDLEEFILSTGRSPSARALDVVRFSNIPI